MGEIRDEVEGISTGKVFWILFKEFLGSVLGKRDEGMGMGGRTLVSSQRVGTVSTYSWRDIVKPYL